MPILMSTLPKQMGIEADCKRRAMKLLTVLQQASCQAQQAISGRKLRDLNGEACRELPL